MANTFIFDDDEPQSTEMASAGPEMTDSDEQPEASEGNNRTFLIAAIVLGGVVLLSLICMTVYVLVLMPGQQANAKMTEDANSAALTATALANQLTQEAAQFTPTLPPTETPTLAPTETPVVVFATSTPTLQSTSDPATATVQALQTQLAVAQTTATAQVEGSAASATPGAAAALRASGSSTPTAGTPGTPGTPGAAATKQLAKTGFADEVGLPGLFILSLILVAIIFVARRLRQTPLSH